MEKGKLLIISGFSGVGKGTVVENMLENFDNYKISISCTTRDPRPAEEDGVHYHFISKDEFEKMIENDELLEHAKYVDNYYGTPKKFVEDCLKRGENVILEIESEGARKVKAKMPEAIMIFVLPPSAKHLKDRLIGRNTEDHDSITKRLLKAVEETDAMKHYEYFVVNDQIDDTAKNIDKIVTNTNPDLPSEDEVLNIKNEIINFSKGE
ncbi:MAG: guanylate kinase [Eubacterium sp.]|nr:guanylate kinase [Eubacterium sp.]